MIATLNSGKTKNIYLTENADQLIAEHKDTITAFNNKQHNIIKGKGIIISEISAILFDFLNGFKVPTHFIKRENDSSHKIIKLNMIPIEVVIRNIAAGSLCKNLNIQKGTLLNEPILEFYFKDDKLNDPFINESHIKSLKIIENDSNIKIIKELTFEINHLLKMFFSLRNIDLVDMKLEFGYDSSKNILLGDELSPDNLRLWDKKTKQIFDKDIYRQNLGNVLDSYSELLEKINKPVNLNLPETEFKAEILIAPRKDILDPQSLAITNGLKELGFKQIKNLKASKTISLTLQASSRQKAKEILNSACTELLCNTIIEDYKITVK